MTAATDPAGRLRPESGRVHLVYPHGERLSTPDSIGRELGQRLETRYEVIYYDWSDRGVIVPEPGDVLVGHPHPNPKTVFRRSLRQNGWWRRLMLAPFEHGDLRQIAFEDALVSGCDLILAITGPYWFRTVGDSACSHWRPKMVHLDLAIDRSDFPPLKASFAAPGRRHIVYIGHKAGYKNTPYLSAIAALVPETEFAWIGGGPGAIRGLTALGRIDFSTQAGRDLIGQFDFLLTVGKADANPTTILEAMAWGLIPICTPTSGYEGIPSVPNVPADDPEASASIIRRLLMAEEVDLVAMKEENWRLLDEHYTWDRFAAQVTEAIESTQSPRLLRESLKRRLGFSYYAMTSPHGWFRRGPAGRLLSRSRRLWEDRRAGRTA